MIEFNQRLLISIVFIFAFILPQTHNIQLKLTPDCLECHQYKKGEYPSKENPHLIQCPRTKTMRDFSTLKQSGIQSEVVLIDVLSEQYGPVIFAHEYHASMSRIIGGCANCHHYSEHIDEIQACIQCHPKESSLTNIEKPSLKGAYHRQCLNCHRDWSHETGCIACHEAKKEKVIAEQSPDKSDILGIPHPRITAEQKYVYYTPYEPASVVTFHHTDHVDQFGLKCVSCHQGDNCGRCHELGHKREKIEHVKTCITCHSEDNCVFCHSTVEKPPFNHTTSTGWELSKYHINNACQDCHGSTKSFVKPSTVCVDCHIHWEVGSFIHDVTGLILDEDHKENECGDCHIDMDFSQAPSCTDCHDEIQYPDEYPGELIR